MNHWFDYAAGNAKQVALVVTGSKASTKTGTEQRRLHSLSLACEYSRLSLLLVAREVSPGGTWRDVPSSEVREETTVFAGYAIASLGTRGPFLESPGKLFGPEIKYSNRNIKNKNVGSG